jgi:hypothetical protein
MGWAGLGLGLSWPGLSSAVHGLDLGGLGLIRAGHGLVSPCQRWPWADPSWFRLTMGGLLYSGPAIVLAAHGRG